MKLFYSFQNATLTLVGLDPKFSNAHEMVLAQLSQSDEKIELISMDKVKRDFIRMFAPELKLSPILKDIEMETEDNGLRLKGKQRLLKEGRCTNSVVVAYLFFWHWTASDINFWVIHTLFFALNTKCLENIHLLKSFQ